MLIIIHANLILAFMKALLDGPSHGGCFDKLCHRDIFWRIGDGMFHLPIHIFAQEQPLGISDRQSVAGQIDANTRYFGDNGSFGALRDDERLPRDLLGPCQLCTTLCAFG